jgi:hypothetical protein
VSVESESRAGRKQGTPAEPAFNITVSVLFSLHSPGYLFRR